MADDEGYHHGQTIRAFRLRRGLTQAQLAERWPSGSVNPQYVQRIETGKKRIADQETLRQLGALLDIPLWRFGLSEYDPFNPHNLPGRGLRMYAETLDVVECLIRQAWSLRGVALLPNARECLRRLNATFGRFVRELPPPSSLESRFLRLLAQVRRLNAVTCVEREDYTGAMALFGEMREIGERVEDAATLALALTSIGAEHERAGRTDEALDCLERARDTSFGTSKHVAAFVHGYLARAYASAGSAARFERALETALTLADALGSAYGDGTDFVFARRSAALSERSLGYLKLGEPRKTLALRDELLRGTARDGELRLRTWIALDWARAHIMLGEIEAGVAEAHEFYRRAVASSSQHALGQARTFTEGLMRAGHGDLPVVRDFARMLAEGPTRVEGGQGK